MKKLSLILILICASLFAHTQTKVVKDASGNYTAVSAKKESKKADLKPTGHTFTDSKGNKYPIYQGAKGGMYIIRTSAKGNTYKQYLKTN